MAFFIFEIGGLFVGTFILSAFLARRIGLFAARLGIRAPAQENGRQTSLWGGLGFMALVTTFSAFFLGLSGEHTVTLILAFAVLIIFGLLDDIVGFSPAPQFAMQAIVAGSLIWSVFPHPLFWGAGQGNIANLTAQFTGTWNASLIPLALGIGFLFILLLGFMNAINWLDGIDGLAGTSAGITFLFGGTFALAEGNVSMGALFFLSAAAVAGFLKFNLPPARLLMGTSGSMGLGLFFAALSAFHPQWLLFFATALGLPLGDACAVIVQRIFAGHSPFRGGDRRHLHYRLYDAGWKSGRIVGFYAFFTALFAMLGVAALVWGWGIFMPAASVATGAALSFATAIFISVRRRVAFGGAAANFGSIDKGFKYAIMKAAKEAEDA